MDRAIEVVFGVGGGEGKSVVRRLVAERRRARAFTRGERSDSRFSKAFPDFAVTSVPEVLERSLEWKAH